MSASLIAQCMDESDDSTDSESQSTVPGGAIVACDNSSCSRGSTNAEKGINKRKRVHVAGQPAKKSRHSKHRREVGGVMVAIPHDNRLKCIFVDDECIPLWPQYSQKATGKETPAAGTFIRVGPGETWLLQLMTAFRKRVRNKTPKHSPSGYQPQTNKVPQTN